uniref:Colanic acid biosynthesis glycosyl transferase WcaE n=1 Tax=Providencia alcalifaciens TaxID=126385 RepID=A0A346CLR2_9GAMM|nr:colanic acid biosynthesis glycosyl transferase WcaE [Providencia alcalifaciens]
MKISIITICRNNPKELITTIESYSKFLSNEVEAIIIDGSENIKCIKTFNESAVSKNENIAIYKQKTKGLYPAMNEGVTLAKGESIIFMNSGDTFNDEFCLKSFLEKYSHLLSSTILCGGAKLYYKDFYKYNSWNKKDELGKEWFPSHQAVFMPSNFLKKNNFSESLKISADTELQKKAFQKNNSLYIDQVICNFELGGISSKPTNLKKTISHCRELIATREIKSRIEIIKIYIKQIFKLLIIKLIGYRNYLRLIK